MGVPEPFEIERKFLIEYPDTDMLNSLPNCEKVEIIQTYLNSKEGEETRIRQRGSNGNYVYFKTTKRTVTGLKRIEVESRLTKRPIRKDRYCLSEGNRYFEIDVYPFWQDKAIMEIELSKPDDEIIFPDYINVIKEVTDDISYKNASLAEI